MHQGGERTVEPSPAQLHQALARLRGSLDDARQRGSGGHVELAGSSVTKAALLPLRLGTKPVGILAAASTELDLGTLDALGGVVAIAIERSHFLEERKKTEALSQRADLASALLGRSATICEHQSPLYASLSPTCRT